jgi:DNA-binding MarR family transcriptional regulator
MNKFNKVINKPRYFGTRDLLYPAEIHAIDVIGKKQAERVTQLCKLFGVTKGAASQIIKKLCDKGYVHKERNKDFGKEKILSLTNKGRRAFEAHADFHAIIDKEIWSNVRNAYFLDIERIRAVLYDLEGHIDRYLEQQ